jgi:type II secretory pathway component PulJ
VVLLEVLIALSLFVMAAAVIGTGMRTCTRSMRTTKLSAKAANLAQTVMTRIEAGQLEMVEAAPKDFGTDELMPSPYDAGWTYEVLVEALTDSPGLKVVSVVVRSPEAVQPAQACRLSQWMFDPNDPSLIELAVPAAEAGP